MGEMGVIVELGRAIKTEAGVVALVLFSVCALLVWLFLSERKYHLSAWASHNEIAKQTNEALNKFSLAITLLSERLDRQ